jgi:hypothetical protein
MGKRWGQHSAELRQQVGDAASSFGEMTDRHATGKAERETDCLHRS